MVTALENGEARARALRGLRQRRSRQVGDPPHAKMPARPVALQVGVHDDVRLAPLDATTSTPMPAIRARDFWIRCLPAVLPGQRAASSVVHAKFPIQPDGVRL
jgi:hypothetical protein